MIITEALQYSPGRGDRVLTVSRHTTRRQQYVPKVYPPGDLKDVKKKMQFQSTDIGQTNLVDGRGVERLRGRT